MAEDTPGPKAVLAGSSFDIIFMVPGKHSVMLFLPEEYHGLIGLVVAYWGNFEVVFDSCLDGLIRGEQADGKTRKVSGWKRQSFKARRTLFTDICEEWLSTRKPEAAHALTLLLDQAAHLHSRRNLIAHGTYGYTIPPNSSVATECFALSASTNEKLSFDEHVLKQLYHDISHLTADLVNLILSIGKWEGDYMAIPDAEILRIYHDTTHPWNPDPKKRPDAV